MRPILTFLAAAALSVALAVPAFAGMLDDIRSRGTVRIGVSLGGEPIGFRDAQNNPVGYDVDVATMLAAKLGVPVEFTDVSGDARISMLVSGQLDIVVANTSATLERAKTVDFSIPYNRAGLRIIVQADSGIKDLKDLTGKSIVVGRGTTGETFIKKAVPDANLVYVDQFAPDGVLQLQQKRVDAAIEDSSLLDYLATKNPSLVTLPGLYSNDPIGIAVAKGDPEFVRWLDMFVSDYIQSGAYEANYKKWWGDKANPPKLTPIW
ncbi:amino acid ABC transporter substrate-binding protein [Labrys miyagiensis]|uniref:Amino acid ABC transporter substrate-binding protein n=1 Tax=Labrys miyagiensis TaxID=346912 RepID=A0ABQ6CZF9_9HYPH|nr:transporter substrate-binding domain-containing protein [Labrys miyagiensis]GLS23631.1 amino acid ABC transporter substrate-binding protein [Labrys miyagiensis]